MTIADYVRAHIRTGHDPMDAWWAKQTKLSVWIVRHGGAPRISTEDRRVARVFVGVDWLHEKLPTTLTIAKLAGKLPNRDQPQTGVSRLTVHPTEENK